MQRIAHPRYGAGGWISQPPRLTPAMQFAILASILVHAAVLSLRFAFPDASRLRSPPQTLDVILVNSKSATRPAEAQALAQANLDGGGNTDENRRAKTPLPATHEVERGDDVKRARQKVKELEAQAAPARDAGADAGARRWRARPRSRNPLPSRRSRSPARIW